jgi:hypothetical protein
VLDRLELARLLASASVSLTHASFRCPPSARKLAGGRRGPPAGRRAGARARRECRAPCGRRVATRSRAPRQTGFQADGDRAAESRRSGSKQRVRCAS